MSSAVNMTDRSVDAACAFEPQCSTHRCRARAPGGHGDGLALLDIAVQIARDAARQVLHHELIERGCRHRLAAREGRGERIAHHVVERSLPLVSRRIAEIKRAAGSEIRRKRASS